MAIENVAGHSLIGRRSLAIRCRGLGPDRPVTVTTPTFIPPEAIAMPGYALLASPTLYPGQTVRARVAADGENRGPVACRLVLRAYDARDELTTIPGPAAQLAPGADHEFAWRVGDTGGAPIAEVGLAIGASEAGDGVVYLDHLTWDGAPEARFTRPAGDGTMWRRAWVDGVDQFEGRWPESFRIAQNEGTGLISQGTREWRDYRVSAAVTPYLAEAAGIGARVQGMRRYYALLLCRDDKLRLIKAMDGATTLAETDFAWDFFRTYELTLEVVGASLRAWVDGRPAFAVEDGPEALAGGGVALICEEGCLGSNAVMVEPAR